MPLADGQFTQHQVSPGTVSHVRMAGTCVQACQQLQAKQGTTLTSASLRWPASV